MMLANYIRRGNEPEAETSWGGAIVKQTADVVVIGGGVIGASTAFHLAERGMTRVILLERSALGGGATGKSGAVVRMHYTNPYDAALAQQSLPYFQRWSERVGFGDPRFVETGVVRLVAPRHESQLRANVEMLRGVGVNTCLISPDDLRAIDPGCRVDDITCAAYEPESGYADPAATTFGFAARAKDLGVEIQIGVAATAIETEGTRITGVVTREGTVATDTVVVAAGAWSAALLAPLGLDYGLEPNRVQVVIVRRPAGAEATHPTYIDGPNNIWLRPEGEMTSLAGVGRDQLGADPDFFNQSVDFDYIADVQRRIAARRTSLSQAIMRGGWAGVITMSQDGHAIIDELAPYRRLYGALGDSGTNFKTAPAIGKCLAESVVTGEACPAELEPFRSGRFDDGGSLTGQHEYGDRPLDVFR